MPSPDDVASALGALGFRAPGDALRALVSHLTKTRASPAQCYEQLVALERRERDAKNLERRNRAATLGAFKALDRFDWNHPRSVDRGLYEELLELSFLDKGENILFRGQSGIGKTNLAQALGHAALTKGHTVRFTTLAGALADLLRHESIPAIERRLRRYTQPDLLILDELGYIPCDASAADLLFRIVSKRHESRPVVITTNLSYKQWSTVFGDAPCLGALVDRFAQHCHVIDIDADSWRDKERLERSGRPPRKPKR